MVGNHSNIQAFHFDFRDKHYQRFRYGGTFEYSRSWKDSSAVVTDILNNQGLHRLINGEVVNLSERRQAAFTSSLNSVIYFALLPYRLNDDAVKKRYIGETEIDGRPYCKVEVTFTEDGGGEDFEDVFVFWIHHKDHTMDYLAYSYDEEKGRGYRFRSFYNRRVEGDIIFQDFENYQMKGGETIYPGDMDELYLNGELELLSKIELENVVVERGPNS